MKRSLRMSLRLAGWLAAAFFAVAADSSARSAGIGPRFKGPIGLQLYSLRAEFTNDVAGTLKKVKDYGFRTVELAGTYNLSPEKFKQLLEANGLKAVSGHFPFERYRDDVEGIARDAKALGLEYVGCAWIPHEGEFNEKLCRDAIAVFNRAGEALAQHGLKFFYHVHGYEFQRHGKGTLLDLMMSETKPESVHYQMDLFWILFPGQDPVKLLKKYGKRWDLVHVKDMKTGVRGDLTGHTDVSNDVVLGTGQMNWPAVLKMSAKVGVKYYFIEDESPSAAQQIPQSLRYLENLNW